MASNRMSPGSKNLYPPEQLQACTGRKVFDEERGDLLRKLENKTPQCFDVLSFQVLTETVISCSCQIVLVPILELISVHIVRQDLTEFDLRYGSISKLVINGVLDHLRDILPKSLKPTYAREARRVGE
jgi:hypothetical protein